MRLPLAIGPLVLILLAACKSESEPPVYLEADYQLRCIDCDPRMPDAPIREVALLDGEEGWKISCSIKELSGRPAMTLDARYQGERADDKHGLRITRAHIGGDVNDQCVVRVTEGVNEFEGGCTKGDPDPEANMPCKVSFKVYDQQIIRGNVLCDQLPQPAAQTNFRYLVKPGGKRDQGMSFEVYNCEGL
jgi:hypothetical protein